MQQMVHAGQVVEGYYKPGKGIGFNNSAFLTEMGYTVHQFAENPALALEILHPDDRDCFIRQLKESFIRHRAYSGEVRYLQGSGKTGSAYLVVNEQTDPEGTPILYHFRFIDITGLSAYGRPPENDPGYYLRLLDYQEDLIAISLPDTTLLYVNQAYAAFHGSTPDLVIGVKWIDYIEIQDVERYKLMIDAFTPESNRAKIVNFSNDFEGRIRWHEWDIRAFYDKEGVLQELFTIGHDITELKLMNDRLGISEARYRAVVETQGGLIIRHRVNGTILFVNEPYAVYKGVRKEDLVGKNLFSLIDPEMADLVRKLIRTLTPGNPVDKIDIERTGSGGNPVWFSWSITGIFNDRGELFEIQVVGREITDRKEGELQLKQAHDDLQVMRRLLEQENLYLREKTAVFKSLGGIVADSACMYEVFEKVRQVAMTDAPVLLLGETGTGKELIAHAIHRSSKRQHRTMVTVNCAALPSSLIESELFGREKGAYTGALTKQIGRFELANYSTLFLDEIGELPNEIQVKLLRVLQFGEYQMLGSPETRKVDVRIIAATNKNLAKAVSEGNFRNDLFYRLNVFPITIPPLRNRKEDIPSLVFHFIDEIGQNMGKRVDKVSTAGMNKLLKYDWPGNVRELRNIIEYNMILAKGPVMDLTLHEEPVDSLSDLSLEEQNRIHIERVLQQTGWKIRGKEGAAEKLGMKESTLRFRMKKLGIERKG